MNDSIGIWPKGAIRTQALQLGAVAVGFARAEAVEKSVDEAYDAWLAGGNHGAMSYMERFREVRTDPRRLLPGAKTVVSLAFPYRPPGGYHHACISDYALGRDYHQVLKERLQELGRFISEHFGGQWRVCVDTAPIAERYWAWRSGVGFIGMNRQLIVPGVGSGVFLGELLTTIEIDADAACREVCAGCGRCVEACPGGALSAAGLDARRCRSYLTIEYRGEIEGGVLGESVYGCDICQRVCPHNGVEAPEPPIEFLPDARLVGLDRRALGNLTSGDWRRLTKGSAMRRIPYKQLKRNLGQ